MFRRCNEDVVRHSGTQGYKIAAIHVCLDV